MTGRIVVGIDGSHDSDRALAWAIEEAARRDASVEAVHVWSAPAFGSELPMPTDPTPYRQAAWRLLEAVLERVGGTEEVQRSAVPGPAGPALVEAAEGADLLVLGERGHGALLHALLGSVTRYVTTHATCPVVVLPHTALDRQPT